MRSTYITKTPDQAGAFLISAKAIAENGGNIVRVNYNKAVDENALFIEVEATKEQQERIAARLKEVEYLADDPGIRQIILIELKLPDRPGTLLPTLEVIKEHDVNISYINSQENGTPYQNFKMGLVVEDSTEIKGLIDDISKICEVRVLDYDGSDHLLDSTVFYVTFANEMRELLDLSQNETNAVLTYANQVMQTLDEREESPEEAFANIRQFARFITEHTGDNFEAKVTTRKLADNLTLYAIEPPCGSNIYVLEHYDALLFIDCGFGYFEPEMDDLLNGLFKGFSTRRKSVIVTNPDVDNCGLLHLFDTVYLGRNSYHNFELENRGKPSYRERNELDAPYVALSKIISRYEPPHLSRCAVIGKRNGDSPLEAIGAIRFGNWMFQVIEGAGGHVRGETIVACPDLHLVFTGDLFINAAGLTDKQREYEALQPALMANTDVNPGLAALCRNQLMTEYGTYTICPGRGPIVG
ncbi:MAG: hypothetical protein Q4G41_03020 [Coriobacteriales bacterium]|jgi:ACT domain-containing protein/glyoxylase-like metal-dependent hydrolase (beta-lactamase superfamily II)|nr:hypothetical protein [Coriobacteriales bacterium]MDO5709067.1 hypothetical protein [Coriobacteriales bacterium]